MSFHDKKVGNHDRTYGNDEILSVLPEAYRCFQVLILVLDKVTFLLDELGGEANKSWGILYWMILDVHPKKVLDGFTGSP